MAEAVRSGNRQSITETRREFGKAKARFRRAQEQAREQASSLASIVSSWGDGKAENRGGWCQALHTVISRGQGIGMGSILFHAYPQEVVDSTAARTNGIRTQVRPRENGVCVVVEGNCLFSVRAGRREFLLRWDQQTDRIMRDARLEPQSPNVGDPKNSMNQVPGINQQANVSLPDASICLLPDQENRSEYEAL
jgi:hypothetical protein